MAIQKYGLDLGTENIKIYKDGVGIILKEKNMIAVQKKLGVVAYGDAAHELYERSPENIHVFYPMNHGCIASISDLKVLMDLFLKKTKCNSGLFRTNAFYFSVPSSISEVEKRAFFDLASSSEFRAKDLYIIEKPLAAAVGEHIDVLHSTGHMLVDFGADTVEISIIAMGGIIASRLLKTGSHSIDLAIIDAVKKKYRILIGHKTAQYLKHRLGSATQTPLESEKVCGRSLISGLPMAQTIEPAIIYEAIQPILHTIVSNTKDLYMHMSPNIRDSIDHYGILLTGNGSSLRNLNFFFESHFTQSIYLSDTPDASTINGIGQIMANENYKKIAFSIKEAIFN